MDMKTIFVDYETGIEFSGFVHKMCWINRVHKTQTLWYMPKQDDSNDKQLKVNFTVLGSPKKRNTFCVIIIGQNSLFCFFFLFFSKSR